MKWKVYLFVIAVSCFMFKGKTSSSEIIKLGMLPTQRSDWGKTFEQMNSELIEKSDGTLQFQFYFGRDEKELINLLESKQIDAVSVSAAGLGQIIPEIFIFNLPLMFSTYEEFDYIRDTLTQHFSNLLDSKGFTILGWGDLGFTYPFSKEPIKTQTDLQRTKLWAWDIDPIAKAFATGSGREPVLLPIQSVLSSLSKGDIQTVYGPPLACIVYQWHTEIRYMTDLRVAVGLGATIIQKSRIETISSDNERLLKNIAKKYHEQLVVKIRRRNEESVDVLKEQGIEIISVPHQERQKWNQVAMKVQDQFIDRLYEKELLDKVKSLLEEYRRK
ncbi:MAG: TRAP transporter substrate-binding protein DctP [Gemmatimonadota bacterium]|nr:MAG: TRAP transporter substrate-binding protein DctP [Gemmatimonadota bacterium]